MAPSFYHYLSVPMDEKCEGQGRGIRRSWLVAGVLVLLVGALLVIPLVYFAVRANSEACTDGLRAQDECRNTTHLLHRQLTRAQDSLTQAETQANTCNRTVVSLQESLQKEVSQTQQQQARIQELENEVTKLHKELETLRNQKKTSSTVPENSGGPVVVSSLLTLMVTMFTFLLMLF
ncbi:bone marrow stromal antigen 2 [Acomys russatus]|uniref:bone marrow stromal antigen 2 n=1 Tax=Acomys russatus TaxID=60746 RepID=UPI0021E242AC|nr:bone marrow stromal antigen 2 [Acomys russatus]